jgi:hypothetical protein
MKSPAWIALKAVMHIVPTMVISVGNRLTENAALDRGFIERIASSLPKFR